MSPHDVSSFRAVSNTDFCSLKTECHPSSDTRGIHSISPGSRRWAGNSPAISCRHIRPSNKNGSHGLKCLTPGYLQREAQDVPNALDRGGHGPAVSSDGVPDTEPSATPPDCALTRFPPSLPTDHVSRRRLMPRLKSVARAIAYRSGLLGLAHRLRNKDTLTVFMFHRVLPVDSDDYDCAEREYTFTRTGFGQCLDFIRKHYNVIDLDRLKAHTESRSGLPNRAGLITFDDGWRDTALYALPELKKRGLPAVLFLATSVLDAKNDRWWQDALVEIILSPGNLAKVESSLNITISESESRSTRIYRVTACVGGMTVDARQAFLQSWNVHPTTGRQMLSREEVRNLDLIRVAGHGHSHIPLIALPDPLADLQHSRILLQEVGAEASVMSFPHGAVNEAVRVLANRAGFVMCFSSDPVLMDTRVKWVSDIGRIHIPENEWTAGPAGVDTAKLATFLFFRPRAA